jgi:hypothetical protein
MVNYANGKIYKLASFETDKVYIGSTCEKLSVRKAKHKRNYKMFLNGKYHNVSSFELIKLGDVDIILLEECPCENKEQLHKRERYHIENTPNCVNRHLPTRTKKEYREENQIKLKQYFKDYNEQNRELVKHNKNQVVKCCCGISIRKGAKSRHEKTLKHLKYAQIQDETQLAESNSLKCSCGHYVSADKKNKKRHEKTQKHLNSLK